MNETLRAQGVVRARLGPAATERELGVCCETARGLGVSSDFKGLSAVDGLLLACLLRHYGEDVFEVHTHVGCGMEWVAGLEAEYAVDPRSFREMYARRADACILTRGGWIIAECKPMLDHKSIGQSLFYRLHLPRVSPELAGAESVVVCEDADRDFVALAREYRVGVAVVGGERMSSWAVRWLRRGGRPPSASPAA